MWRVCGGSPFEYGTVSYQFKGLKRDVSKVVLDRRAEVDVLICHVLKTR